MVVESKEPVVARPIHNNSLLNKSKKRDLLESLM